MVNAFGLICHDCCFSHPAFAGTDGNDGPTDAAGAIADGRTVVRAVTQNLSPHDYLDRNDAYHFFQALQDLLVTGPTGTNVMDVYMVLVGQ